MNSVGKALILIKKEKTLILQFIIHDQDFTIRYVEPIRRIVFGFYYY